MKASDIDPKIMSLDVIQKKHYIQRIIDVTDTAQEIGLFSRLVIYRLGLVSDLTIYVSDHVWEHFIVWNDDENKLFGVHESQQERLENILSDAIRVIAVSNEEPHESLFFNRSIMVRNFESLAEPEPVLFKMNFAYDQNGEICLLIYSWNL